jgi:hypothetical protein
LLTKRSRGPPPACFLLWHGLSAGRVAASCLLASLLVERQDRARWKQQLRGPLPGAPSHRLEAGTKDEGGRRSHQCPHRGAPTTTVHTMAEAKRENGRPAGRRPAPRSLRAGPPRIVARKIRRLASPRSFVMPEPRFGPFRKGGLTMLCAGANPSRVDGVELMTRAVPHSRRASPSSTCPPSSAAAFKARHGIVSAG